MFAYKNLRKNFCVLKQLSQIQENILYKDIVVYTSKHRITTLRELQTYSNAFYLFLHKNNYKENEKVLYYTDNNHYYETAITILGSLKNGMNIVVNNESSCDGFRLTLENSACNLLLISPYSRGEKLGNKLDLIAEKFNINYLKYPKFIKKLTLNSKQTDQNNLRTIIQISTNRIQRCIKFSSAIKFANEELKEIDSIVQMKSKSFIEIYYKGVLGIKISYDEFCSKLNNLINNLIIKEYSVVGSLDNSGIELMICLLLPIMTKSQIIFFQDCDFDQTSSLYSIDHLILNFDSFLNLISRKIQWIKVFAKLAIISKTINIKEIKKIIKDSKINCNVYIIDDNLDIIKVN